MTHPLLQRIETLLAAGARVVIRFNDHVESLELDPDSGMMAEVLSLKHDGDEVTKIRANFSAFEAHNRQFAKANYYDENGQPTLTWFQLGYPKDGIDTFYVDQCGRDGPPFDLIEDAATQALYEEYRQSPEPRGTYVAWLERSLLATRRST